MNIIAAARPPELTVFEDAVDRLELAVSTPVVIQTLLAAIADPRSSLRDVEGALSTDPALVTRVLKLASSAAYACRPVRDLAGAIQTVGLAQLRRLAVTAHFTQGASPLARELWAYSLAVAFTCERMAATVRTPPGPDPFLCGLLHDIGKLVLERLFGARYTRLGIVPGDAGQGPIEQEHFGFDHADLGAMAVARWNLFPELELVVQLHHQPLVAERLGLPGSTSAAIELVALARSAFLATSGTVTDVDPARDELFTELARRRGVPVEAALVLAQEARAQAVAVLGVLS